MPSAVLTLDFDPTFQLAGHTVPWETVAIAAAILLALVVAALVAGRTPERAAVDDDGTEDDGTENDGTKDEARGTDHDDDPDASPTGYLRRDDVLLIALGAVPGAVAVGRLLYGLTHVDYYRSVPSALFDPSLGSLSLSGAVIGATLTGAAVAHLLGPAVGRWLRVATFPALIALAAGKAAMILGGDGQGVPNTGQLAVRFAGPGPWQDPAAAIAAQPSQLFEAAATVVVLLLMLVVAATGRVRRGGALFGLAIALWAMGRFVVAFTWRDPTVLGSLRAEQLVCLAIAAAAVGLAVLPRLRRSPRRRAVSRASGGSAAS